MKQCGKCKKLKSKKEFFKNKNKKDGLHNWCKFCAQQYREANKEAIAKYQKQYRKTNKEAIIKYYKQWYEANKEAIAKYQKQYKKKYYKENKEAIIEYKKQWYEKNPEYDKQRYRENREYNIERVKKYYKENKEARAEYYKQYYKKNKEDKIEYSKQYRKSKALFDTFYHQIDWFEDVRRDPRNKELLQVRCTNSSCKKWFNPTNTEIQCRIQSLNLKRRGEGRFYCSNKCKQSCSIYNQNKYPKGQKPYHSRLDQAEWAELVKERDNYQCVRCGSIEGLVAHHIEGLNVNPLESADIDIGITLCSECDKKAHSEEGCRYIDLKKENVCGG